MDIPKSFKDAVAGLRPFWVGLLIFWLICLLAIASVSKATSFFWLNQWHNRPLDVLFTGVTYLGDGLLVILLVAVLLVLKKYYPAFAILAGYLVSGLGAQIFKALIKMPRPYNYFQAKGIDIHNIEGITLQHSINSFPSGHTATAFALVLSLLMVFPDLRRLQIVLFLAAIAIGYSRIFVGNHFLPDVLVGSMLGIAGSLLGIILVNYGYEKRKNKMAKS
ncbi:MAG TPA: phosphatase PAP2 family protein [Phnomibacter sp.]|nr:phosphatase PAP2 family protein [Phnomibacter sp.]